MIDTISSSPPLIAICGTVYMGLVVWVMFFAGKERVRGAR